MLRRGWLVFLVGLLLAADAPNDALKKEKAKLQGQWKVVGLEANGQPSPEDNVPKLTLVFAADKITAKDEDKETPLDYKLDVSTTPKLLDVTFREGDQKGKTLEAIYALDGDNLKICVNLGEAKNRPGEFATKQDSGLVLLILKREKK